MKMYSVLEKYKDELYTCNRSHCGFCQEGCQAYKIMGFEQYSSRGRMLISRSLIENRAQIDESVVDSAFNCFLCGFCNAKCALYPTDIFMALRREIKIRGLTPEPILHVIKNISTAGNPYAFSKEDRWSWFSKYSNQHSEILYFPGCVYSYLYPKNTETIFKLLKKSGFDISYSPEIDFCCGYPTYLAGDYETFQRIATENFKKWKNKGIKKIYTPCPGCYKAIGEIYPEFVDNFDIEAQHVVLGLFEAYESGKIVFNKKYTSVTYHDPCDLTRFMKVVEEPRKLIEAVSNDLIETTYNKFFAKCCGGGGLVLVNNPKLSLKASIERVKEMSLTGADYITTACPTCYRTLNKGLKKAKIKMKLLDLEEMLFSAFL